MPKGDQAGKKGGGKQQRGGGKQQQQQKATDAPRKSNKGSAKTGGNKRKPATEAAAATSAGTGSRKGRKGRTRGGGVDTTKLKVEMITKRKFQNPNQPEPNDLELKICSLLVDLEASSKDYKKQLRDLAIVSAKEVEIGKDKKAIIVFVPYFQHPKWRKVQKAIGHELEKKFNGEHVLFLAQRKVMKLNQIKNNVPRPRNQTITAVHENILEDVVFPTKIVGKRLRFRVGGKRLLKVYLDPKQAKDIETRLPTYEKVYTQLTSKSVKFMFPRYTLS